jgi:uncharacterized protein YdeI (YjbR/CyaY-like superfamily)
MELMMMQTHTDGLELFHAESRNAWRAWLNRHHADSKGVWLVSYKKQTGKPRVAYHEAVEEALCFGWIDSKPNKLDDERFMQLFSPRKPKSPWSKLNKERVAKLIRQGLMTNAGLEKVEMAKQNGSWSACDKIETLQMPDDLKNTLAANKAAQKNFEAFPPSSKKNIFWWIESAKKPETRQKRLDETVSMAAKNLKANHYRQ